VVELEACFGPGAGEKIQMRKLPTDFFARVSRVFRILAILTYCMVAVVLLWALVLMIRN
jgi:hypothetical protein